MEKTSIVKWNVKNYENYYETDNNIGLGSVRAKNARVTSKRQQTNVRKSIEIV